MALWLLLILLPSALRGEDSLETGLYLAFNKQGPIVIGKISSIKVENQSTTSESGTLTLDITEQLRGEPLPNALAIRYQWINPNSPSYTTSNLKGPPPYGFDRVHPAIGMNVLALFSRRKPTTTPPMSVVDLDSTEAEWLPVVRRAVALETLKRDERTDSLLNGLADPQKFIRVVSMHELRDDASCLSGSPCAIKVIQILRRRAATGAPAERSEAVDWMAHQFYDGSAGDTGSNIAVASELISLIADPSSVIRGQAIDDVDQLMSTDVKWHPDLSRLAISNRTAVMQALKQEQQNSGARAVEASRVEMAIAGKP